MQCEFCRESVADDALICPHCRKPTPSGRSKASKRRWTIAAVVVGLPVAAFVAMAIAGSQMPERAPKSIGDTCKEQFPDNSTLRLACVERGVDDEMAAKMKKASHDAG